MQTIIKNGTIVNASGRIRADVLIDGEIIAAVGSDLIAPGAEVEDCIIMNDSIVGENCQLKYVILDKDVVVRPNTKLFGSPKTPIVIKRGEIV